MRCFLVLHVAPTLLSDTRCTQITAAAADVDVDNDRGLHHWTASVTRLYHVTLSYTLPR